MSNNDEGVLDWEDLSEADKIKAQQLYEELNELLSKYQKPKGDDYVCESFTSED